MPFDIKKILSQIGKNYSIADNAEITLECNPDDLNEKKLTSRIGSLPDVYSFTKNTFENENLDEDQKIKFILASYNVGYGHITDARNLAEKFGKDPNRWEDNVDYYLLNKSNPKFYRDEIVKYGYCRGTEPYKYVYAILDRYDHYKNIVQE